MCKRSSFHIGWLALEALAAEPYREIFDLALQAYGWPQIILDEGLSDRGCEWDWYHTGTRYRPGIQPSDIEESLMHDVDVMIWSRGMEYILQINPESEHLLLQHGTTSFWGISAAAAMIVPASTR